MSLGGKKTHIPPTHTHTHSLGDRERAETERWRDTEIGTFREKETHTRGWGM